MPVERVEDWVFKAEEDYRVALREMRARKDPAYDAVCFHAQQCAEKYMKAFLVRHQIAFRPIHDLRQLRGQSVEIDPLFDALTGFLILLNRYSVEVRYPGVISDKAEAREAVNAMKKIRVFVRTRLGLKTK